MLVYLAFNLGEGVQRVLVKHGLKVFNLVVQTLLGNVYEVC